MKRLITILAASLFILVTAHGQVPTPQITLTGNIGAGFVGPLFNSGNLVYASDADRTMAYPETSAFIIKVTSTVSLTATRNLIAPVGYFPFVIENLTTGGQSIQFIGTSGTGITIPNGSAAFIAGDGTNYFSLTGSGSGGSGVASINGTTGAFTFTGSGVSCTSTTCTFSGSGAPSFSSITSGTNTTGLVMGSGGVLSFSGTGFINANELNGVQLSTLATGLLTNTTSTGVPTITSPSVTVSGTTCTLGGSCAPPVTCGGNGTTCALQQINPTTGAATTTSASMTTGQTTIPVTSGTGFTFAPGNIVAIENVSSPEWVACTGYSSPNLTGCTRGLYGSTASTWASGSTVVQMTIGYSTASTVAPYFYTLANGAIGYNGSGNITANTTVFSGFTTFTGGATLTGASVNLQGGTATTVYTSQANIYNPTPGTCETTGSSHQMHTGGSYSWWDGSTGVGCTTGTNLVPPNVYAIVPGTTAANPTIGSVPSAWITQGGEINAKTGFQVGAAAPSGHCLVGNGTDYVDGSCTGSAVTTNYLIAASNSVYKTSAQYQCTGTNDDACINAAIAACPATLPASAGPAQCRLTLLPGVYNLSASVVIDTDDIMLSGTGHCMWGGITSYTPPVGSSHPAGAVGTGCSQLKATAGSFPLIAIQHNNLSGTGSDTSRHRGIGIRWLYLVGSNYSNIGIQTQCGTNSGCNTNTVGSYSVQTAADDHVLIYDNVFQKLNVAMNVGLDAPDIESNSCQDNSDTCLAMWSATGVISHNLFYDVGGDGMDIAGYNQAIDSNNVGDLLTSSAGHAIGFNIYSNHASIVGNTSRETVGGMVSLHSSIGSTIVGNTEDNRTAGSITFTGPVFSIDLNSTGTTMTGNTVDTASTQTVYAIDNESTGSNIFGNTFNGTWSNGTEKFPMFTVANITAAQYFGPTTAPSGTCTAAGAWVFSQDGGATVCSAGAWVAQVAPVTPAVVYLSSTFVEASAGAALAGTVPATCTAGSGCTWTLASGTDLTYQTGGGAGTTSPNLTPAPDLINTGQTNETIRVSLATCTASSGAGVCAYQVRYTNSSNYIAVNIVPASGYFQLYDVVAGSASLKYTSAAGTVTGAYTIILSGTSFTVSGPEGTSPAETTANTGTYFGMLLEGATGTGFKVTSLTAKSF